MIKMCATGSLIQPTPTLVCLPLPIPFKRIPVIMTHTYKHTQTLVLIIFFFSFLLLSLRLAPILNWFFSNRPVFFLFFPNFPSRTPINETSVIDPCTTCILSITVHCANPLISLNILSFQSSQSHTAISGFLCQYHCALMLS